MPHKNGWKSAGKLGLAGLLWAGVALAVTAKEPGLRTEANVMVELTFRASRGYADPFNEVTLDVTFVDPRGRELRVPGFWAGGDVWKARYASPLVGTHTFRSECSEARDKGLHGITGKVRRRIQERSERVLFRNGVTHSETSVYLFSLMPPTLQTKTCPTDEQLHGLLLSKNPL